MAKPRWPGYSRQAELEWIERLRDAMLGEFVEREKRQLGERIAATRKTFGKKLFVGEVHMHTPYSDGVSTIPEHKRIADLLGLDFLFVTDHRTLRHKRACEKAGLWWGQEPPTVVREIGVLMPRELFVPKGDSAARDFERARGIAPFAWVPHPVGYGGYGHNRWYPDEDVDKLWEFGDRFAMEVLNGASKLMRACDAITAKTVRVWDELLCAGRQVTALGASDAHVCYSLGTAWTGVLASTCTPEAVIRALNRGRSFASEAPLVWLACDRTAMGGVARARPGHKARVRFRAADSVGLNWVRLVSQGQVVHEVRARDEPKITDEIEWPVPGTPAYVRLECAASDGRVAFSSPVFLVAP